MNTSTFNPYYSSFGLNHQIPHYPHTNTVSASVPNNVINEFSFVHNISSDEASSKTSSFSSSDSSYVKSSKRKKKSRKKGKKNQEGKIQKEI